MTRPMSPLLAQLESRLSQMIDDIAELVACESPSAAQAAVKESAGVVARVGQRVLGLAPEVIEADGCSHLRWKTGEGRPRVLLLGHHDTVWPSGSLARHPFAVRDGVLTGPGCFDMKTGVVMALHAAALAGPACPVSILVTGDEEIGSRTSRRLIEESAATVDAVLVLEAAADGGALKVARKAVSFYELTITGRASHAGLEPERGVNAVVELSHVIQRVHGLASPERGTSVVPTVVSGGTTSNTVPALARLAVDVRAWTRAEQERVDAAVRGLTATVPGAVITVGGGPDRPPMEESMAAGLYDLATRIADEEGLGELSAARVGGGSDGNFTAGLGRPTLDGLGAVGGGAHADDEHVLVDQIPVRTALLVALVRELCQ